MVFCVHLILQLQVITLVPPLLRELLLKLVFSSSSSHHNCNLLPNQKQGVLGARQVTVPDAGPVYLQEILGVGVIKERGIAYLNAHL